MTGSHRGPLRGGRRPPVAISIPHRPRTANRGAGGGLAAFQGADARGRLGNARPAVLGRTLRLTRTGPAAARRAPRP